MIGDNVEADIIGPLELGWDTILVKTGVNKHDHPHSTINSDNILDGVKMYL
jgi:ribonucleotide monophosphatase NagD (HAD superfamily)